MNENWPEIVEDLSPCLRPGAIKGDYLRDVGKHSASCVFFSPLFLPTFVASL